MRHGNPRQARGFLIRRVSRRIECAPGAGVYGLVHFNRVHFNRVLLYFVARLIILSRMAQFSFMVYTRTILSDECAFL